MSSHAKNGLLMPTYLESCRMPADLMTKTGPAPRLEEFKVLVGLNDNASETKNRMMSDGGVLKVEHVEEMILKPYGNV